MQKAYFVLRIFRPTLASNFQLGRANVFVQSSPALIFVRCTLPLDCLFVKFLMT